MRKSRFTEEHIIGILKRVEMGQALVDVCREEGISDATYYRWKAQYGGLEVSQLRRLRHLEEKNRKLKQVVADLTLDNRALKDITAKTGDAHGTASGRGLPAYNVCALRATGLSLGASTSYHHALRYRRRLRPDEQQVRERLCALAGQRPRWGYRRLHVLLQRERAARGEHTPINRKRVYRLYRLDGLAIRRRPRKRVAIVPRGTPVRTWTRGEAWAMDFMQDVLANGRRFRTLNILDIVTRECLAIEVDTSLPGQRVVRVLDQLVTRYGAPKQITVDNGPEFSGQVLDAWAYAQHVALDFIEPGKPAQNGYLESFNGKFRDECLNVHWFLSLAQARQIIHDWKEDYNTQRPHSALNQQPPTVFAQTIPA